MGLEENRAHLQGEGEALREARGIRLSHGCGPLQKDGNRKPFRDLAASRQGSKGLRFST